jgi:hypothetical protein
MMSGDEVVHDSHALRGAVQDSWPVLSRSLSRAWDAVPILCTSSMFFGSIFRARTQLLCSPRAPVKSCAYERSGTTSLTSPAFDGSSYAIMLGGDWGGMRSVTLDLRQLGVQALCRISERHCNHSRGTTQQSGGYIGLKHIMVARIPSSSRTHSKASIALQILAHHVKRDLRREEG